MAADMFFQVAEASYPWTVCVSFGVGYLKFHGISKIWSVPTESETAIKFVFDDTTHGVNCVIRA